MLPPLPLFQTFFSVWQAEGLLMLARGESWSLFYAYSLSTFPLTTLPILKRQCHKIFATGFFMNHLPPSPLKITLGSFMFFRKFAEIFASQGAPPISMTPVENLPPVSTTPAAIFATDTTVVNDTCGKLSPLSTTPVANNGNNIRLQTPNSELDGKNLYIC